MKNLVLVLLVTFSFISVKGQTYFDVDFGNDSSTNTIGGFIYEFPDTSGYLAVGAAPIIDSRYLMFIRLDELGDTIWTKMYGVPNLARTNNGGKYINEGDSNIIFSGVLYTDSVAPISPDTSLAMLYKIDTAGNMIWERYYGDTTKQTVALDVQKARSGYIITGWTSGWGAGTANSFLLKVDDLGNEEWKKIYFIPSGISDGSSSVDTTDDGGYIISGSVNYSSPTNLNDMFVLRTDSLGNTAWVATYGGLNFDNSEAYITKYSSNNYLLTGGIGLDLGNGLNSQTYLAKIDGQNGNVIWADTSGIDQLNYHEGFVSNSIILNNGDILIIGYIIPVVNNPEVLLTKYNSNGIKLWERSFNKYQGNNSNYMYDVHETIDKGIILTGNLTNLSIGEQRLWVLKLDSMGCDTINCTVGIDDASTSLSIIGLKVYPNPSNTFINFELPYNLNQINAELRLFDITGKEIFVKMVNSYSTQLDVSYYPKGIYFYQLINEKNSYSGKLVIN
ncbi:MAG: hypothetical protein COA97_11165 [Flavobacteriales bacterium]|nr:MAG: hypothetical protein COA97_11165 [Flavobacteriales bacterium]